MGSDLKKGNIKDVFKGANSNSSDYMWIRNKSNSTAISDHRCIARFHNNKSIPKNCVVHHKDFNSLNNNGCFHQFR